MIDRRLVMTGGLAMAMVMATMGAATGAAEEKTVLDDAEVPARRFIDGWNAHDMAAIEATLAPDADWVNVVGMHWRGRDQIMFAHAAFHHGMFRTTQLHLKSIATRALAPDIAILLVEFVQDAYQVPHGPVQPEALDRLTLVVRHGPEGWRIVHGHNTVVDERAVQNDPVLRMPKAP